MGVSKFGIEILFFLIQIFFFDKDKFRGMGLCARSVCAKMKRYFTRFLL